MSSRWAESLAGGAGWRRYGGGGGDAGEVRDRGGSVGRVQLFACSRLTPGTASIEEGGPGTDAASMAIRDIAIQGSVGSRDHTLCRSAVGREN